jgi:hypothetical protein
MSTELNLNLSAGGFNYLERANTGWRLTLRNTGLSNGTRKLICRWADAPAFTEWLLTCNNYAATSGFATTYIVGAQHPLRRGCSSTSWM